jgi:hypothetical protein
LLLAAYKDDEFVRFVPVGAGQKIRASSDQVARGDQELNE